MESAQWRSEARQRAKRIAPARRVLRWTVARIAPSSETRARLQLAAEESVIEEKDAHRHFLSWFIPR